MTLRARLRQALVGGAFCVAAWGGRASGGEEMPAVATVLYPRASVLLSAQAEAKVAKVDVVFGQSVQEGQILVVLDKTLAEAAFQQALVAKETSDGQLKILQGLSDTRVEIGRAEAVLDAAVARWEAADRLYKDKAISHEEWSAAKRDKALAEADRTLAEMNVRKNLMLARREAVSADAVLAEARLRLDACEIKAPCAGKVARLEVDAAELVRLGQPLIEIADDTTLMAHFFLPSSAVNRNLKGCGVRIRIAETGAVIAATIAEIGATVDAPSRTLEVRAAVDNRDGKLRAGLSGLVELSPDGAAKGGGSGHE